jgi:hypothetical protein
MDPWPFPYLFGQMFALAREAAKAEFPLRDGYLN